MRLSKGILLFLFLNTACSSSGQDFQSFSNGGRAAAIKAYNQADAEKAYQLFDALWQNESTPQDDRLEAGRYLVKLNFRQFDNPQMALEIIDELIKEEQDVSLAYTLKARVLSELGKYNEATSWAEKAVETSTSEIQHIKAAFIYGKSVLLQAREEMLSSGELSENMRSKLASAHQKLGEWLNARQDNSDLARLYLGHSIFLENGEEALEAWRLFFRLKERDVIHPSLMKDYEVFEKALKGISPGNVENDKIIIKGLAESGFVEYAYMMANLKLGEDAFKDQSIREVVKYYDYLGRLDKTIISFYRRTVKGWGQQQDLQDGFTKDSRWLWDQLEWPGRKPSYSQSQFIKTVAEQFKGRILFNRVSGFYGLHVGQIILDDRRLISQYDQSAEFRYILLDHMLSNGYTTWFADGENSVGGWATTQGYFVQVRADLNREITGVWSLLKDPSERRKMESQIERMSVNEERMLQSQPVRYLPGLQLRILLSESQKIVDSLEHSGLKGDALRYAFITHMERIGQDSKIYAHEGRHSIDMKYGLVSGSANLEYTAKLSEIYFSEKPLFFLATILSSNMGNGTSHGDANQRVFENLVKWMETNSAEIPGFDTSKPTMLQLEKLTDRLLKKAIRSLDPMAN
ncbi:hypothetical protein BFP97_07385 [Roseivirga sp. 4D4]|uniref:tetratricopeptide repeat protein n=1 Tax=Roseivirga sp. 4D4 TaxID=1889784 RepID=UPI00085386B3|nr:hypothetical protein [Roseivirga sp. 4D4]OEK01347.1 hypothetical protein BFP97_07385 [Roseivirga sp. 4D4]